MCSQELSISACARAAAPIQISADHIQELQKDLVVHWLAAVSTDLENHPLTIEELGQLEDGDGAESRVSVETLPAALPTEPRSWWRP